jgi:glyoxalase family protein
VSDDATGDGTGSDGADGDESGAGLTDTPGIHHVTGIVRDAQSNVDFYAGALGLRVVRETVNQNDVTTRHLFYGDDRGSPGTTLTFFPYPAEDDGRVGRPQLATASLVVPEGSLGFWHDRLTGRGVDVEGPVERFDERLLRVADPDGTRLELVAGESPADPATTGRVPTRHAVRGLHGVTALPTDPFRTASLLETLGFDLTGQEGDRVRYRAPGDRATVVDLLDREAPFGREGAGSLHHVAVRVDDEAALYDWHDLLRGRGYDVSRVTDRHFFHSLYVREPGGILFELATERPGLVDAAGATGDDGSLFLPPPFEADREMIRGQLPPLSYPDGGGG